MSDPDKLIVVGMRYQKESQGYLAANRPIGQLVTLIREYNEKGVDKVAYRVAIGLMTLGYIRNPDIPSLDKQLYTNYEITGIQTNYLVLKRRKSPMFHADSNPCSEVSVGESTLGTLMKTAGTKNPYNDTPNYEKGNKIMNTNSMRDSFFREVKNAVLDITTGGFGIVTADGISVYKDGTVSVNPIVDMGIKVPAFAMRVDVATLTEGDIILNGNEASFYKGKTESGYEVVALNGEVKQVGSVTNMFFGKNTVLAVKNMMASTGMNPMMMALMMGDSADGKGIDMKTMMLMSMMGNQSSGAGMDNNILMMAMMMGK